MKNIEIKIVTVLIYALLVVFIFSIGKCLAGERGTTEPEDLWKCDVQRVLLVDLDESHFLGKVIGTPFHCVHKTSRGLLFWNLGREDLAVLVDPTDPQYTWYIDQN